MVQPLDHATTPKLSSVQTVQNYLQNFHHFMQTFNFAAFSISEPFKPHPKKDLCVCAVSSIHLNNEMLRLDLLSIILSDL